MCHTQTTFIINAIAAANEFQTGFSEKRVKWITTWNINSQTSRMEWADYIATWRFGVGLWVWQEDKKSI